MAPVVKRLVYKLGRRHRDGKRCEADVREATARWRTHMGQADMRCDLSALYKVGEHHFCARHAGDYLVKLLLVGDEFVTGSPRPDQPASAKGK